MRFTTSSRKENSRIEKEEGEWNHIPGGHVNARILSKRDAPINFSTRSFLEHACIPLIKFHNARFHDRRTLEKRKRNAHTHTHKRRRERDRTNFFKRNSPSSRVSRSFCKKVCFRQTFRGYKHSIRTISEEEREKNQKKGNKSHAIRTQRRFFCERNCPRDPLWSTYFLFVHSLVVSCSEIHDTNRYDDSNENTGLGDINDAVSNLLRTRNFQSSPPRAHVLLSKSVQSASTVAEVYFCTSLFSLSLSDSILQDRFFRSIRSYEIFHSPRVSLVRVLPLTRKKPEVCIAMMNDC